MRSVSTPNQDPRANGAVPRYIVHHHMATTGFEGVLASWHSGAKQGSAHKAISNSGEVVDVVPPHLRAWSLSSEFFDSQALVTEIANESTGGSWPVSRAAHEAAAQVTAEWSAHFGIPLDRTHVIDHGEVYTRFGRSYPTACAGGLDLDWIVARAKEIRGAGGAVPAIVTVSRPAPVSTPTNRSGSWVYWEPSGELAKRLQRAMIGKGRLPSWYKVDGVLGDLFRRAVQTTLNVSGRFVGTVDGDIQGGGCLGIQLYARDFGDYTGPLDSEPREMSWTGFALGLERP